ncbi:MAG: glycosyltransferase [Clostridiales Family XIII bacterium]|nr:glycosyltransferase [Clostridiales Family XIII bacterium]
MGDKNPDKQRVLAGSPVYQKPEILEAFLASLKNLLSRGISIDFMFVDDNVNEASSRMLAAFQREGSSVLTVRGEEKGQYLCNEESHAWNGSLMLKVANYKNAIIRHAIQNGYDFLFLVDSDLIIHPTLIEHLKILRKDIVSEIFWSRWHNGKPLEPNVWLFDEYDLVPKTPGEELTEKEKETRQRKFLNQLKVPGVYEVGGLGACTLLSRNALLKNVNFSPIKNLTIWGEDRFFCVRAAVLGLDLFVDTHYPAYHIYRESDLPGVSAYVEKNAADVSFVREYKETGNKITLSMIVKDEEHRYLRRVLEGLKGHIDEAVIIDDGSTDDTVGICKRILTDIPLRVVENKESLFSNESALRKRQWDETVKTKPDWILNLDADELLEDNFWESVQGQIDDTDYDMYCFRLYDMWNATHYREDEHWNAHRSYRPFLLRYQPAFRYLWNESSQHCGRFPMNLFSFRKSDAAARVQHLGWATEEDREAKFKRYQALDPDAVYGSKAQYDSILDASPNLVKWEAGAAE